MLENSLVSKTAENNLASMQTEVSFIPSIKVTYTLSEHFKEGKAKPGDFFMDETSFGNTIKVTALGYRYQAMAVTKDTKEFQESILLPESETPFRERKEYKEFCQRNANCDIQDGIDILLFLPEHNLFGVFFAKKKLYDGGVQILRKGANGNIVQVKTVLKTWKKFEWYVLNVQGLGETVEVPDIEKKLEIYNSQLESTQVDTEGKTDERTR